MRHPCCVEVLLVVLLVNSSVDAFGIWSWSSPEPLTAQAVTPIVFIPGMGGNQLEAKIDKPSVPIGCQSTSGWSWRNVISALYGELWHGISQGQYNHYEMIIIEIGTNLRQ